MRTIRLRTGIDLVSISRVEHLAQERAFLERAFHPSELRDGSPPHLAGVLAAKEALFKALGMAPEWLAVEVVQEASGRPSLRLAGTLAKMRVHDLDVSISHEGDYAVAVVALLLPDEMAP